MKIYHVIVESVCQQTIEVEANSAEEAECIVHDGEGKTINTDYENAEIVEVTEVHPID